ncbi:MAG: ferritin [Flavobacteriales bacterium]|nr:ferritin [Flavobacteriales bacterium]
MLNEKVERVLNAQVKLEAESSQFYLAMASWAETEGFKGTAKFLYMHSDEERLHMLKLVKFINERGGRAHIPELEAPPSTFDSITEIFKSLLQHEIHVTDKINNIVDVCLTEKDYTTHNFIQWYVAEQLEEEALARDIMDKLQMIGNEKAGLYLFDRDLDQLMPADQSAK